MFKNLIIKGILFLFLLTPMIVNAENKLTLDSNVTIQAGEQAEFAVSVNLDNELENKVNKLSFTVETNGEGIKVINALATGPTSNWITQKTADGKFIFSRANDQSNIITGDTVLHLFVETNNNSPAGVLLPLYLYPM